MDERTAKTFSPAVLELFKPVEAPSVTRWDEYLEKSEGYVKLADFWATEYVIKQMTDEQKAAYKEKVIKDFSEGLNYDSWSFNETSGTMVPPSLPSEDLENPQWNEATKTWIKGE
jgi:hypothetical protein